MKRCPKCEELKAIEEFSKNKKRKDGLQHRCKLCTKQYRKENKEIIKESNKQYYERNKDAQAERMRKWYEKNKKRIKQCYKENKEDILEKAKQYRKKNKKIISKQRRHSAHCWLPDWMVDHARRPPRQPGDYYLL